MPEFINLAHITPIPNPTLLTLSKNFPHGKACNFSVTSSGGKGWLLPFPCVPLRIGIFPLLISAFFPRWWGRSAYCRGWSLGPGFGGVNVKVP